jgi:hypothetical protein
MTHLMNFFSALLDTRSRLPDGNESMKWLNEVKKDRNSPARVMDTSEHREALLLICQWLYYYAQGSLEMLQTKICDPVALLLCHPYKWLDLWQTQINGLAFLLHS